MADNLKVMLDFGVAASHLTYPFNRLGEKRRIVPLVSTSDDNIRNFIYSVSVLRGREKKCCKDYKLVVENCHVYKTGPAHQWYDFKWWTILATG